MMFECYLEENKTNINKLDEYMKYEYNSKGVWRKGKYECTEYIYIISLSVQNYEKNTTKPININKNYYKYSVDYNDCYT